mmetsp:Transcript_107481/g.335075  ORF Transcript_107481/g.335075 Transcript_107481/m.335075 type:complete len:296 (-) Transcript_107481:432-1319(-)
MSQSSSSTQSVPPRVDDFNTSTEASLGRPGCSAFRRSAILAPAKRKTWKTLLTDLGTSVSWLVLTRTWSSERPSGRNSGSLSQTSDVFAPMRSLKGTGLIVVRIRSATSGSTASRDSTCRNLSVCATPRRNTSAARRLRSASGACSTSGTQQTSAERGNMPICSSSRDKSSAAVAPVQHSTFASPADVWTVTLRSRRRNWDSGFALSFSGLGRFFFGKRRMYSSKTGCKSATSRSETSSRTSIWSTRWWVSEVLRPCCRWRQMPASSCRRTMLPWPFISMRLEKNSKSSPKFKSR